MNSQLAKLHLTTIASFVLISGIALIAVQSTAAQKVKKAQSPSTNVSPPLNVTVVNTPAQPVPVTGAITIGNTVKTQIMIPAGAFSASGNGQLGLGPDPAGTSYAITSITVANGSSTSVLAGMNALWGTSLYPDRCISGGVTGIAGIGPFVRVPPGDTVHLTFPQPYILQYQSFYPGPVSCLVMGSVSQDVIITLVGYRF